MSNVADSGQEHSTIWRMFMAATMNAATFMGENLFHGDNCHRLLMKQLSVFSAQKSMSSQILCCVLEGSINIQNITKLGRTELQGSCPRKATESMMVSMESRPNSSGTSSQDSQRCSSVVKSMIY